MQLPNLPLFLTACFSALKAGTVVLPLHPLLRAPEITYSSPIPRPGCDAVAGEPNRACQEAGIPASAWPARAGRAQGGLGGHRAGWAISRSR